MPETIPTGDLEELLWMLEGARIAAMHQHLTDEDLEMAMQRAGEVRAYNLLRQIVADHSDAGELPGFVEEDHWQAYAEMAQALAAADEALADANGDPKVGVQ